MAVSLNSRARVAATSFLLFCLSLFFTAYSSRHPVIARYGYMLLAELQRPFQLVNSGASSWVSDIWETYVNLINVNEENQQLRHRVSVLEALNSSLLEFKHENQRLKSLLNTEEEFNVHGVAANVIGYDPTSLAETVILDRGSSDGVKEEAPVVLGDGLVGQIVAVSLNSSRALLIIDPASAVDALVQNNRVRGLVRGAANKESCDLLYVLREDEIKVGDRIITSGIDQVFPKGLLVGVVSKIEPKKMGMFQSVEVKPLVNFEKLETVLIVTTPPVKSDELQKPSS